jgi:multidrug efflux pump subunit AcrA (membrane-fusion protein)
MNSASSPLLGIALYACSVLAGCGTGSKTVLVLAGERCAERAVRIGASEGDLVAISAGLNPGDRVILAPPAGLKAGDLVEVISN